MKVCIPALLAALALVAGASYQGQAAARQAPCLHGAAEGTVVGTLGGTERRPCAPSLPYGALLYRGDRLKTTMTGQLTFKTRHIDQCKMLRGSRDVIFPRARVALEHKVGTIICQQGRRQQTLRAVGTVIRIPVALAVGTGMRAPAAFVGSIIIVTSTAAGTVVKVVEGTARVGSTKRRGGRRTVRAGRQVFVPYGARPRRTKRIVLTVAEKAAVESLKQDVPANGVDGLGHVFSALEEKRGAVVGETPRIVGFISGRLSKDGIDSLQYTKSDFTSGSAAREQIRSARPRVTVVAGTFAGMSAIMRLLRSTLGSDAVIVFVPLDVRDLLVVKRVINDNGGTAVPSAFRMHVTGANPRPSTFQGTEEGTDVLLDPGRYSMAESGPAGYGSSMSADCTGTIANGDAKTCTVTNDDQRAHLTVIKQVSGGGATPSAFTIHVTGGNPVPNDFAGSATGTGVTLDAGKYSVGEAGLSGYSATASPACVGTIANGETKTCTITNSFAPPPPSAAYLIVTKVVVNDNGGAAIAGDFTMHVTGNGPTPNAFSGSASGTTVTLGAGDYEVTELGPSGYTPEKSPDCEGAIGAGETKTCTITNDDQPAHLIVSKHVINDDGGTAVAGDFTMHVDGGNPAPNDFPGSEDGTDVTLDAGSYNVTESMPSDYDETDASGCTGTVGSGETNTCEFTNDDIPIDLGF